MQTPKPILLHLDSSARTAERVKVVRQIAEAFEAEVTGVPCTVSALMPATATAARANGFLAARPGRFSSP